MAQFVRNIEVSKAQRARGRQFSWFWRGILVAIVTHSLLAAADFSANSESVWSDVRQELDLFSPVSRESSKLVEVELEDDTAAQQSQQQVSEDASESVSPTVVRQDDVLNEVVLPRQTVIAQPVEPLEQQQPALSETDANETELLNSTMASVAADSGRIYFAPDVPASEILRVRRAFNGMVQETMRSAPGQLQAQFLGSLGSGGPQSAEELRELETSFLDELPQEAGYAIGEDVDTQSDHAGLDPFKTYTVVDGRIHAVTPTRRNPAAPVALAQPNANSPQAGAASSTDSSASSSRELPVVFAASEQTTNSNQSALNLSQDEVSKGLNQIMAPNRAAALDAGSAEAERVTIQGRVLLPEGFARDKVLLRMAGTAFQVQTDASGAFELRDVPRGTRFELLVWHTEGSLTRRLVPVTASGRERALEISLQKLSDVDALASSFGLVQQMNQGGFCSRVESESLAALTGGRVLVTSGRKNLQAHFFSAKGLPSVSELDLTTDGRFCVFNIDESLVDVKVTLLNGVRRQFVVHVEPSTFEHDLVFDMGESLYRKIALMEPLDTQQVLELSAQGVKPEFGDKRLRDWMFGSDVPVWTPVSRFVLQTDPAYAPVRPNSEDLQFFPGGQEFVEVRLSADAPGVSWSRVLLSRDNLFTKSMLKQLDNLALRVIQDRTELLSMSAIDADSWDDIVAQYPDVPRLQSQTTGGLYVSVDPLGLGVKTEDLIVSVRDTWTGKEACSVVPLRTSKDVQSPRYLRAVCGASAGQYALIVESKAGALLWSDVVRIRPGDVQTVTVLDPKF